jgi:hypothetical protein
MSDYDQRQTDRAKREDGRTVTVGEVRGRATGDIKKTDEIRVRIDKVDTLIFYPAVDEKKGDSLRIIIEKV